MPNYLARLDTLSGHIEMLGPNFGMIQYVNKNAFGYTLYCATQHWISRFRKDASPGSGMNIDTVQYGHIPRFDS